MMSNGSLANIISRALSLSRRLDGRAHPGWSEYEEPSLVLIGE